MVIVFDRSQPSTKDGAHKRRNTKTGQKVSFTPTMSLRLKKQEFLSNDDNKQHFINLLAEGLKLAGFDVHNAHSSMELGKGYLCVWFEKATHSEYRPAFFKNNLLSRMKLLLQGKEQ